MDIKIKKALKDLGISFEDAFTEIKNDMRAQNLSELELYSLYLNILCDLRYVVGEIELTSVWKVFAHAGRLLNLKLACHIHGKEDRHIIEQLAAEAIFAKHYDCVVYLITFLQDIFHDFSYEFIYKQVITSCSCYATSGEWKYSQGKRIMRFLLHRGFLTIPLPKTPKGAHPLLLHSLVNYQLSEHACRPSVWAILHLRKKNTKIIQGNGKDAMGYLAKILWQYRYKKVWRKNSSVKKLKI